MTIMSDAAGIIGNRNPGDYALSPVEHADQLSTSAPKLAALLTRSAPVELARQYSEADTEARAAERTFKRWIIRANWAVLATATVSALLMAVALLGGSLGALTQTILILLALIGVAVGGIASMSLFRVKEGRLLEDWMTARARAETKRLSYFNYIVNSSEEGRSTPSSSCSSWSISAAISSIFNLPTTKPAGRGTASRPNGLLMYRPDLSSWRHLPQVRPEYSVRCRANGPRSVRLRCSAPRSKRSPPLANPSTKIAGTLSAMTTALRHYRAYAGVSTTYDAASPAGPRRCSASTSARCRISYRWSIGNGWRQPRICRQLWPGWKKPSAAEPRTKPPPPAKKVPTIVRARLTSRPPLRLSAVEPVHAAHCLPSQSA